MGLALAWLPLRDVVLLLAGGFFVGLLLVKPALGVYLLIPVIPFSPLLAVSAGGIRVGVMELLLALGLGVWLLQLAARLARPPVISPLGVPFLIFLGGVSLSWLNSLSIGASLVETVKWVEMLALYLLVVALVPRRHLPLVVIVVLVTGTAQALLGLYQFLFKVGPPGFLLFGGLFLRAYGTFAQPNPYAGYLGLVLPLALAVTLWAWSRGAGERGSGGAGEQGPFHPPTSNFQLPTSTLLTSLIILSFFLLMLAGLFASQSRGAWLGFVVAAVVTLGAYNRKIVVALVGLGLAASVALLAGTFQGTLAGLAEAPAGNIYSTISQRLVDAAAIITIDDVGGVEVNDANFATIERLAHWQAAREMWRDNPWLGVGFGNYEVIYPAYAVGRWLNSLGHAHNYYLNIGAEAGLVGLIAYLIFWFVSFRVTWLAVRGSAGFERAVAAGGLGILAHLHIHNLFDNLYVQGMYLYMAIVLALISIIYHYRQDQFQGTERPLHPVSSNQT